MNLIYLFIISMSKLCIIDKNFIFCFFLIKKTANENNLDFRLKNENFVIINMIMIITLHIIKNNIINSKYQEKRKK